MANTKISALTENTNPTGGEELVYAYNNANGKMTLNTMKTFVQPDLSSYQEKLVSGTNIKTINGNSLLGSGNIDIQGGTVIYDYSAMKGPSPTGYHVPTKEEWMSVYNIWTSLGGGATNGAAFSAALKLPYVGYVDYHPFSVEAQGQGGLYRSCSKGSRSQTSYDIVINDSNIQIESTSRSYGYGLRCFKDVPITPNVSWTKMYGISVAEGGIFWDSVSGLISLSSDGTTWITISDKNLGATTVWNSGDALSSTNCGNYYQWGNNYGFDWDGTITTSSTRIDTTGYGPGNFYSSSSFIASNYEDWSNPSNDNLWGGETGPVPRGGTSVTELTADANIWELSAGIYETEYKLYYISGTKIPSYTPNGGDIKQRIEVMEKNGTKIFFSYGYGHISSTYDCRCSFGYSSSSSVGEVREVKDWKEVLRVYYPMANTQTIDGDIGDWVTQIVSGVDTDVQMKVLANSLYPGVTYTTIITSVASGENYTISIDGTTVTNPLNITLPSSSTKPCVVTFVASDNSHAIVTGCTIGS